MTKIIFQDETEFEEDDLSLSLLDISLKHGIPMHHVCGRAMRCTSCRVEVVDHLENVSPPKITEGTMAQAQGWPDSIRLACQTYLTGPVTVRRIVKRHQEVDEAVAEALQFAGSELNMAVVFSDIRAFTSLAERRPPYDVLYILNRYYNQLGEAVLDHHGYLHQYYGDGILALFGFYARDPHQICLDAVAAGLDMLEQLEVLNQELRVDFGEELKVGIGIHFGELLAGRIGHAKSPQLTVVGDVVNMAQRVQETSKKTSSPLVISDVVYWELGATVVKAKPFKTQLKGKTGSHRLYQVTGFAPGYEGRRGRRKNHL